MVTITENYVSFEIAKLLKEKGFDCPSYCHYRLNNGELCNFNTNCNTNLKQNDYITAPTLQMAVKWLREVHNIDICAFPYQADYILYSYNVKIYKDKEIHLTITDSKTYEQACETAIKYCLEKLI